MLKKIKNNIGKNTHFFLDYLRFSSFLKKEVITLNDSVDKNTICVLVLPWMGTAVPWYAITQALLLARAGKNVLILVNDIPFGDDVFFHKFQAIFILRILNKLPIKFVKLSKYNSLKNNTHGLEDLLKLNSLHYTKGETNYELRKSYEAKISKQLEEVYFKAEHFFDTESFSQMLLPGGVWGSSSLFSLFTRKRNMQLSSYDCAEGVLLLSIFGVAAQLKDIPFSFNKILDNQDDKLFAITKGQEQLQKRREGHDFHSHFLCATNISEFGNDYYLMLLNSVWDTAALGLHTVYESMFEWIIDSIDWVLNNTQKTIIIRQHPAERVAYKHNTDSYEKQIENKFGKTKRIIFIEAKKDVNTYDLVENASCVLGFSSTSIVESVILGKPAIIVSSTYYADFGIVFNSNSKEEYYSYLEKSSKGELKVTQDMKNRACISNYITQGCNWCMTEFTPDRNNFLNWSKYSLSKVEQDYLPLKAIIENIPMSLLRHNELKNAH